MSVRISKRTARKGMTVYHSTFTSWGKGVIREITSSIFDTRQKFYVIDFDGRDEPVRLNSLRGIRSTPNRKKIKSMVALYESRGFKAVDGGDRLVLPDEAKGGS